MTSLCKSNALASFIALLLTSTLSTHAADSPNPNNDQAYLANIRAQLPTPGQPLLGATLNTQQLRVTFANNAKGNATPINVTDADFSQALRVTVKERTKNAYDIQVVSPNNQIPIAKGDMLFVAYTARCLVAHDESGEGMINTYLHKAQHPWTNIVGGQRRMGKTWQQFNNYAIAQNDWETGEVNLTLHVSPFIQTIEIGGIVVLNLGQNIDASKMPSNKLDYPGRALDAPWRAAAAQRIEQHRKGDLTIEVTNAAGEPLSGIPVTAQMTRHAYGFGSFFDYRILDESGTLLNTKDAQTYAQWFLKLFSKATTPMYWSDWGWETPANRKDYHHRAKWLQDNQLPTKGHVLVWPAFRWLPRKLKALEDKPAQLRQTVKHHITEAVDEMKPYDIVEYDVMNEPRVNNDIIKILGDDIILEWWQAAHKADGRQALYINEYGLLTGAGHTQAEQDTYINMIQYLLDNGAPIGGIGMQGHMSEGLTPPARLISILDRFAKLNLPIQVSEFDIEIDDEQAQADYTRDFYTALFSHPATNGVTQWGFWEQSHWKPRAAMFRKDWTLKPNGQAYIDLILNEWWTDEKGATDKNGRFTLRGFCGDYKITVGQNQTSQTCTLSNDGKTIYIALP